MAKYSTQDLEISKYAKALAHPARVAILQLLLKRQTCICGDIVDELPIAQSTVSQHLKELKKAGLIKGEIEGVSTCYCINETAWAQAKSFCTEFFKKTAAPKNKCC
jgi:DNA-binding transcriptional ArsR family regulator